MNRARLLRVAGMAAVAVLVLEILRAHVAQRYLIPSRSMEPTLHGDPERGDIVLVDKTGLVRPCAPAALSRFDMVVVRDGDQGDRPLVKRVGSLGDELLKIQDGDLFIRPMTGGPWERVAKDPVAHRDLRFTFFECGVGAAAPEPAGRYLRPAPDDDGRIALPPMTAAVGGGLEQIAARRNGAEGRFLRTLVPIDVSFLDAAGRRSAITEHCCDDIGIEVDVELGGGCTAVVAALVLRGEAVAVALARDGTLTWGGAAAEAERGPRLHRRASLAFGYLDGRLFVEVDGALVAVVPHRLEGPSDASGRNEIRLGVVGGGEGAGAKITRLRLFHDVYYHPENQAWVGLKEYRVEPHEVFLLGDNTFDSVDSRTRGPFQAKDIVGRPLAVIGPLRRARWLVR